MSTIPLQQVWDEFATLASDIADPMRPHVLGAHAQLVRYGQAAEKAKGLLGTYSPAGDAAYAWPNLAAGGTVDLDYVKVYLEGALLRYFEDLTGADSTIVPVTDYANRIRSSSVVFKANGATHPRSAALNRDVAPGDIAIVSGSVGGTAYSLTTYVKDFVGEAIAAVTGAATAAAANKATQGSGSSLAMIAGDANCITPVLDNGVAGYEGFPDGVLDETYTVTVTTGSVNGDLSTAVLKVTSASGLDDVAAVSPSASGDLTVGARGLTLQFELTPGSSCSDLATGEGVSPVDLLAGQTWTVHVVQAYTATTAAASGTYTGTRTVTYTVKVTKGGLWADNPTITCTTDAGVDASGPTKVTGAGTAFAVGSLGVLITFTGTGLVLGDAWTIKATAATVGNYQTLVLGQPLPVGLQAATDLNLQLCIKKNLQLPAEQTDNAPNYNWTAAAAALTLKGGARAFDASWTAGGVEVSLPIVGGTAYVEYRAWLDTYVKKMGSLSNVGRPADPAALVAATLGPVHPDNPLAYGVWLALLNSGGAAVGFTGVVPTGGLTAWTDAVGWTDVRRGPYNLVPLSFDPAVQAAVAADVAAQSAADTNTYRGCFLGLQATETAAILAQASSADGLAVLATVADDPATAGTQYTYFSVTSGNATLLTLGVRAGDTVRYAFGADAFGTATHSEDLVATVVSETDLTVATALTAAVTTPSRVEVWRNYTTAEVVAALQSAAAAFNSDRVCAVWPDSFTDTFGNTLVPGYFLGAALAGLRGGMMPHRTLRGVALGGVAAVPRSTDYLSAGQLRTLGTGRVLVIAEDDDGTVYTKYPVTTADPANVELREEAVRNDKDACAFYIYTALTPYLENTNFTGDTSGIWTQVHTAIQTLKTTGNVNQLGAMLLDASIATLRMSVAVANEVVVQLDPVVLPLPFSQDLSLTLTLQLPGG